MVVFPIFSTLISALCAIAIARDALRKPRPDRVAWTIAFALFAIAAGCESLADLWHWTPTIVRVYYLTGAVLVVGFLALGELYLLAERSIERYAPGIAVLVSAFAAALVFSAPVDRAELAGDGWEALQRTTLLSVTTIGINAGGTLAIAGGLLYSAWQFRRMGLYRNRMIGCVLIAAGTLIVAMGGTATRLGARELLYVAMAIGVAVMYVGYLWTKSEGARRPAFIPAGFFARAPRVSHQARSVTAEWQFISETLALPDEEAISLRCAEWSAPRDARLVFDREEAIAAWRFRKQLAADDRARFDALSVPVRRQLVDLHRFVLEADELRFVPGRERVER